VPQAGARRFTFFRKSVTDPPGAGIRKRRMPNKPHFPTYILGERAPLVARKQQDGPVDL